MTRLLRAYQNQKEMETSIRIPLDELRKTPTTVLRLLKVYLSNAKSRTYEHRLFCAIDAILLHREGIVKKDNANKWEYC